MLGDLKLQLFGFEAAGLQGTLHRRRKVFLLKLAGRDVNGDGKLHPKPALQRGDLFAGLKKNPLADGDDEAGLFGERNKGVWPDQAEFRAVPAKKRLHAEDATICEGYLRLIKDL